MERLSTYQKTRRKQFRHTAVLLGLIFILVLTLALLKQTEAQQAAQSETIYNVADDIEAAKTRLAENAGQAEIVKTSAMPAQKVELVFEGMTDAADMERIVALLQENDVNAVFYFTGTGATVQESTVDMVVYQGYEVGSNTLKGAPRLESYSESALLEDFCRANLILELIIGDAPKKLMCRSTEYTDALRAAAYACGIETITEPDYYVSFQSFDSQEDAQAYVDGIKRGSILCLRLDGALEGNGGMSAASREKLMQVAEWLIKAINSAKLENRSETLRAENGGALAEPLLTVRTTARMAAFTFSNFGNSGELRHLLDAFDTIEGKGTFFATREELGAYREDIELLLSRGHALGIGIAPTSAETFDSLCEEILLTREALATDYGQQNTTLVMQTRGSSTGEVYESLREAASATGCTLVGMERSVVRADDVRAETVDEVYPNVFQENTLALRRGQLVHFKMNGYERSATLLGELVKAVYERLSLYPIRPLTELLEETGAYDYPLAEADILPEVKDRIYPGQLKGNAIGTIMQYYIGNPDINVRAVLPGFTSAEIGTLDKRGRIANDDGAVFLTFDDWGSDAAITSLLDVLAEHEIKATFFIRTGNVVYNPNLLRAIAEAGHELGCHTHNHMVLANYDEKRKSYSSLDEAEQKALAEDLIASYAFLQSVVGDIRLENGRPALTTFFRPPTLAVSKEGLSTVFDCGFSYSVSGNYTTHDYEAPNAEYLYKKLTQNVRAGTVIVMHMSDTSEYTAEALELFFSANEARLPKDRLTFALLGDYLTSGEAADG